MRLACWWRTNICMPACLPVFLLTRCTFAPVASISGGATGGMTVCMCCLFSSLPVCLFAFRGAVGLPLCREHDRVRARPRASTTVREHDVPCACTHPFAPVDQAVVQGPSPLAPNTGMAAPLGIVRAEDFSSLLPHFQQPLICPRPPSHHLSSLIIPGLPIARPPHHIPQRARTTAVAAAAAAVTTVPALPTRAAGLSPPAMMPCALLC